jgi:hypothetical protein
MGLPCSTPAWGRYRGLLVPGFGVHSFWRPGPWGLAMRPREADMAPGAARGGGAYRYPACGGNAGGRVHDGGPGPQPVSGPVPSECQPFPELNCYGGDRPIRPPIRPRVSATVGSVGGPSGSRPCRHHHPAQHPRTTTVDNSGLPSCIWAHSARSCSRTLSRLWRPMGGRLSLATAGVARGVEQTLARERQRSGGSFTLVRWFSMAVLAL